VTCHYGHVNRFYYLLTYLLLLDEPSGIGPWPGRLYNHCPGVLCHCWFDQL